MDPIKLHIFDFDETLYFSPGNRWHSANVAKARRSIADPLTVAALLTARPNSRKMRAWVDSMLAGVSLEFDTVTLRPDSQPFRDSARYKAAAVAGMLRRFPTVKTVVLYDDQRNNLDAVGAIVKSTGRKYRGVP